MKLNKVNKVRRISGMFAALLAIIMVFTVPSVVLAQTAEVPTLTVGDSAYFGGVKDIGEEYKAQIDEALQQYEGMGFNINYDISGGMGAYMGWEVVSNSANINGNTCYDIKLTGALAINIGFDGSVSGSANQGGYTATVDGSGSGFVEFEATLDGHLFLTVDSLAIAKLQLTIKAEGKLEANIDATASMSTQTMIMKADATASIVGAQLDFLLEFDPPMDIYQFPISLGETWYVPNVDTQASGSINAQGTISYDVNAEITGQTPTHESNSTNLATEIGDNNFNETIPGGAPDTWGGGGMKFNCSKVSGNIFIIEADMFGMMDTSSIYPGTRQFSGLDPASMLPSTGLQFDKNKGMITGVTLDGQAMTSEVPKADVDSFVASPMEDLTAETGGRSSSSGSLLMILVIVIVIVVVIVVVVMVAMRKKTPPVQQQHPQPMYQQPPPPPQQYPPQDQYGQQQYQQPPQQGQYPPPPPPPGQ
jgi:hypothetical protein